MRSDTLEVLVEKEWYLTPDDHQKHIKIPFELKQNYEELKIYFEYSPQLVENELALKVIEQAVPKYFKQAELVDLAQFLPLENLITLSVAKEEVYLGCRHHKATNQLVSLSETTSSLGYSPVAITPGKWEVQLHGHAVISEQVFVKLKIIGGMFDELS